MYAVIASGGKQEKVTEGQQVALELLSGDEGAEVSLTPVLVVDGETLLAGPDALATSSVTGKIVGTTKGPKINGFTYKPKSNQRRRWGHRQHLSLVEIADISVASSKPKSRAKKAAAAEGATDATATESEES